MPSVRRHLLRLESFEIAAQGTQAFLAIDIFTVRQDQTKDLRIGSSEIVDRLSLRRQKSFEPFLGKVIFGTKALNPVSEAVAA